jgi:hypothetical protein
VGILANASKRDVIMIGIFPALLLSLQCTVKPPAVSNTLTTELTSVIGITESQDKKLAGKPCVGVATMLADKTLIFYYVDGFYGQKHLPVRFEYKLGSAGYKGAAETIGIIRPGEAKAIPPSQPTIGVASMSADGTLTIKSRMESSDGVIGEGMLVIRPSDQNYNKIVQLIDIKPGQLKPMPIGGIDNKHNEVEGGTKSNGS